MAGQKVVIDIVDQFKDNATAERNERTRLLEV